MTKLGEQSSYSKSQINGVTGDILWPDARRLRADWVELKNRVDKEPLSHNFFQSQTNSITADIFKLCLEIEAAKLDPDQIKSAKQRFLLEFKDFVRFGSLNRLVMDKLYGYAGDFYVIDQIYQKNPKTIGFERCMDEHFLNSPASVATRNRKEDFKGYLINFIRPLNTEVRIMNLACGPCRDVVEMLTTLKSNHDFCLNSKKIIIDCIDHDVNALNYAKRILDAHVNELVPNITIRLVQKNALRISLAKNVKKYLPEEYNLIYSTGLFDYLEDKLAIPLIKNLKASL